jgi:hypothetical protein
MKPEDVPPVKCPLCGHVPCELLDVGSDPDFNVADTHRPARPVIHAKCLQCSVEFHITIVSK